MALIAIIEGVDAAGAAVSAVITDSTGVSTGAGNTDLGITASITLPVSLNALSASGDPLIEIPRRISPSGTVDVVTITCTRYGWGAATDTFTDLEGATLVGYSFTLIETGTFYGVTYTVASPRYVLTGTMVDGTDLSRRMLTCRVQPQTTGLLTPAMTTYEGYGPAWVALDGGTAHATWEVWDETDFTISSRFWLPIEDWDSGGTRTLFGNADVKIQLVARTLKVSIVFSGGTETITSYNLERPEAWYWWRLTYLDSTLTANLYINGELIGTATGSGSRTTSGNTWTIGANQAAAAEYFFGLQHDLRMYDAVLTTETADLQEAGPLKGNETNLYAWLEGEMNIASATLDNAAVADQGGGLVRFPDTGHSWSAGQTIDHAGFAIGAYNGRFVIVAKAANTYDLQIGSFSASTLAGTEVATGSTTLWDKAQVNSSSPKNATVLGFIRGSSLTGGVASSGTTATTTAVGLAGQTRDLYLGLPRHVRLDLLDGENQIYGAGQAIRFQDFVTIHEAGVALTMTRASSLLALYALLNPTASTAVPALGEAIVYPGEGVAAIKRGTAQGAIAADLVAGSPWIAGMKFDGVDDEINLGTGTNSIFADSFTLVVEASLDIENIPSPIYHLVDNVDLAGQNGFQLVLLRTASGGTLRAKLFLQAGLGGANLEKEITFLAAAGKRSFNLAVVAAFTTNGSDKDVVLEVFQDAISVGTDSATVPTANIAASGTNLYFGARANTAGADRFFEGTLSNISIVSNAKDLAWTQRNLHRNQIAFPDAGTAAAQDGTEVKITSTGHPFVAGESVERNTTSYTGNKTLHADTDANTLVFTESFSAETFDGDEQILPADLDHYFPGAGPDAWDDDAATWSDKGTGTAADGTITGAVRVGGVAPTSPRSLAAFVAMKAGFRGSTVDYSDTTAWPDHGLDWWPMSRDPKTTWDQILVELLESLYGARYVGADGTLYLGWHQAPEDQSIPAAQTFVASQIHGYREDAPLPIPASVSIAGQRVHHVEDGSGLAGDTTDTDRALWRDAERRALVPVPGAPPSSLPMVREGWWHTIAGAQAEAERMKELVRYRRFLATVGFALDNADPAGVGLMLYVSVSHQDARTATVEGYAWKSSSRPRSEVPVEVVLWGCLDAT